MTTISCVWMWTLSKCHYHSRQPFSRQIPVRSDRAEARLSSQQCKELSPLRMSVTDLLCLSFTSEQVLRYCAAQYQVRQGSWIKLTGSLTGGKKKHLDASCHQQKKGNPNLTLYSES